MFSYGTTADGVLLSVWKGKKQIWPDRGAVSTEFDRDSVRFSSFYQKVEKGDMIYFRVNCNENGNNDRVFWEPVISYQDEEAVPAMISQLEVDGDEGLVRFQVKNAEDELAEDEITLWAVVDGLPAEELEVKEVELGEKGLVEVSFDPLQLNLTEKAVVQLEVGYGEDHRIVTYEGKPQTTQRYEVDIEVDGEGEVVADQSLPVEEGSDVVLTLTPKEGYEIFRLVVNGKTVGEEAYADGSYRIENITSDVKVKVYFRQIGYEAGTCYYVDAKNGSDDNQGTSPETAWKSLDKVNRTIFLEGDQILFKAGDIWNGYLYPQGEGTEAAPITISSYGDEDAYPIINGDGSLPYDKSLSVAKDHCYNPTVLLSDQSHWVIENLEVTNQPKDGKNHVGILIFTTGVQGMMENVTVRNCYVHDVTASVNNSKMTGGILAIGAESWIDGQKPEEAMAESIGFSNLVIENNHVKNVAKEGIRTSGQSNSGSTGGFRNTKTFQDIVIRGNYIEEVFGDGIVLAEVGANGVVENNVVKNHCNYDTANYAGAWMWYCSDSVFRYNEVFGGEYGYNDGEAFDFDIGCKDTVYEYNYSHDNKGGLLLTMYDDPSYEFRYNISANDGKPSQELFHCETGDMKVYNNTIYIGKDITTSIFDEGTVGFFKNNIVMAHGKVAKLASSTVSIKSGAMENNIFYPQSILAGQSEAVLEKNLYSNPKLSAPQKSSDYDGDSYDLSYENMGQGDAFIDGLRERMDMFRLQADSPAINAGVVVNESVSNDIFGNEITDAPDIGAHEFNNDPGETEEGNRPERLELDKTEVYLTAGESLQLRAKVYPENVLDQGVYFVSSDESVATVDSDGLVKAVSEGVAEIKAVCLDNEDAAALCVVHVYQESGVVRLPAVKDARVRDDNSQSGTETSMTVKLDGTGYSRRVLMGFDLKDAPENYRRAVIRFHVAQTDADNVPFALYAIGNEWEENSVTWKTAPELGEKLLEFTSSQSDSGEWMSLDLTDYIRSLLESGQSSFSVLFAGIKVGSKNMMNIHSRESDYVPVIQFETWEEDAIVSAEDVYINTAVGHMPELPEEVFVTLANGSRISTKVTWETISEEQYNQEGRFTVAGHVDGWEKPVAAYVTVSDNIVLSVEVDPIKTPAGQAPVLPAVVRVRYINGTYGELPVTWEALDSAKYQKPGQFELKGMVEGYEPGCTIQIEVTEALAESVDEVAVVGFKGYEPTLPATVTVRYSDGSSRAQKVTWDKIDAALYETCGQFVIEGSCGLGDLKAQAEVNVVEVVPERVQMESAMGKYPALPDRIPAQSATGDVVEVPVVWEPVDSTLYTGSDVYVVYGVIENTDISVEIEITPSGAVEFEQYQTGPSDDSYIQVSPSDKNFGTAETLWVKNVSYDTGYQRETLLRFELDEKKLEEATSAVLKLYLKQRDGGNSKESFVNVYATGTEWTEERVSYDSATQAAGYKQALICENLRITPDQVGSYIEFPVTDALAYAENGCLALALDIRKNPEDDPQGDHSGLQFASKEMGADKTPLLLLDNDYISEIQLPKVSCMIGETPVLPAQIRAVYASGAEKLLSVTWHPITDMMLSRAGEIMVKGEVEGLYFDVTGVVTVNEKTEPEQPDPEEPEKPDPEEPEKPDPEVPEQPDPEEPEKPDPEVPGQPDPEVPEQPDPETPETPAPEKSSGSKSNGAEVSYPSYMTLGTWQKKEDAWTFHKKNGGTAVQEWIYTLWNGSQAWYYFDDEGKMVRGWLTLDHLHYYLNPNRDGNGGKMLTGWQLIDGRWYCFKDISDGTRGALYQNTITPDGYSVDENGVWVQSETDQ